MPDTKNGRERKGRNKREQLEARLTRRELRTMDAEEDLPEFDDAEEVGTEDIIPYLHE
jgi:ribose 1,5-bisphosphokinase PhnN